MRNRMGLVATLTKNSKFHIKQRRGHLVKNTPVPFPTSQNISPLYLSNPKERSEKKQKTKKTLPRPLRSLPLRLFHFPSSLPSSSTFLSSLSPKPRDPTLPSFTHWKISSRLLSLSLSSSRYFSIFIIMLRNVR